MECRNLAVHTLVTELSFCCHRLLLVRYFALVVGREFPFEPDDFVVFGWVLIDCLVDHPRTCKWLITPIYKPWKGHLEGEQPQLWLLTIY